MVSLPLCITYIVLLSLILLKAAKTRASRSRSPEPRRTSHIPNVTFCFTACPDELEERRAHFWKIYEKAPLMELETLKDYWSLKEEMKTCRFEFSGTHSRCGWSQARQKGLVPILRRNNQSIPESKITGKKVGFVAAGLKPAGKGQRGPSYPTWLHRLLRMETNFFAEPNPKLDYSRYDYTKVWVDVVWVDDAHEKEDVESMDETSLEDESVGELDNDDDLVNDDGDDVVVDDVSEAVVSPPSARPVRRSARLAARPPVCYKGMC